MSTNKSFNDNLYTNQNIYNEEHYEDSIEYYNVLKHAMGYKDNEVYDSDNNSFETNSYNGYESD